MPPCFSNCLLISLSLTPDVDLVNSGDFQASMASVISLSLISEVCLVSIGGLHYGPLLDTDLTEYIHEYMCMLIVCVCVCVCVCLCDRWGREET